jgi:hypothetical protein
MLLKSAVTIMIAYFDVRLNLCTPHAASSGHRYLDLFVELQPLARIIGSGWHIHHILDRFGRELQYNRRTSVSRPWRS